MSIPVENFLRVIVASPAEDLAEALRCSARDHKVNDLVVEISPTRGFRVVQEGNPARGTMLSRHALIGAVVCLTIRPSTRTPNPVDFWKEVLS